MISLPSSKTLAQINLGMLLGIFGIGCYYVISLGPYSVLGFAAWAPHCYNYIIWGGFGAFITWKRWGMIGFPALFMMYSVDEIIWTLAYVTTTCDKTAFGASWFSLQLLNGSFGYFLMIVVIAIVTFVLVKPRIVIKEYVWLPFIAWFLAYIFIFHMPIMGNECLPNLIPSNLGWEILWQFSFLIPAYFTFYPRKKGEELGLV